jgi:RING-type zinc-finger
MEIVIECIICKESYNSLEKLPLILTCGHTLCKECLVKMNPNSLAIKCPIDRKIESKSAKQLTVNYAILQILNLQKSGSPTKEVCLYHSFPITMICKTCSSSCCYKCIRSHTSHDVYDADHPSILKELETNIRDLSNKIEDGYQIAHRSCERIKKELRELNSSRNKLKNEITVTYDCFIRMVESKRKESLDALENKFRDKEEFLNSCYSEAEMYASHYENYNKDLEILKKQYKDKSYIDRAVTCSNMIKKMLFIQHPSIRDINSSKLRLGIDASCISDLQIPSIKFLEFSPAEILEKTYFMELEDLQNNYNIYKKLDPEHKLSLEISCSSLYVMIRSDSLYIAKVNLLNYCCWEIMQQDCMSIDEGLRKSILEKASMPNVCTTVDYMINSDLLSRIRYAKGVIFALQKIHEKQWEDALSAFHCIIMKENQYWLAEEYLQILLLKMCSFSFAAIKSYQVIDSLPIVLLIKQYVKYHFLPTNVVYQQVVSSLKYAYLYVKNNLPDFFFPFFQQRYSNYLSDLEGNSVERLGMDYPHELQYSFSLLTEDSVRFWKNKELSQIFIDKFEQFKEECSPWFQALNLIRDRNGILLESELIVLERS